MSDNRHNAGRRTRIDAGRRRFLAAAGGTVAASMAGGLGLGAPARAAAGVIRWGIVGTGGIANSMAGRIKEAPHGEIAAVSSRRMETANAFGDRHGIARRFESWAEMAAWDGIDAVYIATPTSVREEICVAAARNGKHVLGEKPFASLPSLQRITAACRENGVGFMDGTHFVHHPRTAQIKAQMQARVGWPWSLDSAFQFFLANRSNIRFSTELEPMGAIGDAGWYNMRAAAEYISAEAELVSSKAVLRRDKETGAAISGSGVMVFDDGATSTWNCGFDSGAVIGDMRITGANGVISTDRFLMNDPDGSASYLHRSGGWGPNAKAETVTVPSELSGATLMFEDFAAMVDDKTWIERSIAMSERTQRWLDAAWDSAIG